MIRRRSRAEAAPQPPEAAWRAAANGFTVADARVLLASELDFEATLPAVSRLAVPEFADCAVVDLVGMDGTIRRQAAACSDPAKEQFIHELQRRYPPSSEAPIGSGWIGGVIEPSLVEEVTDDVFGQQAIDPEHLKLLRQLGLRSTIVVPLRARGLLLGAMAFAMAESGRRYRPVDLTLAHELAGLAALAVDNARLFRDAQEALRQRDRVLTSVSHDLRTPLTTIRGMLQILTRRAGPDTPLSAPRVLERLSLADRAAAQMGSLIDEIVDLAYLEDGRPLELQLQRTELVSLVRKVVERVEEEHAWHRITVEANLAELYGISDGRRLERALVSLLGNAVQFSPEDSPIAVRIHADGGDGRRISWCEVTVTDCGAGIAPELQPHLFERHYGRTSHSRTVGRGNVGLFGSHKIVQAHGGTLTVESQEGEGSTFRIRLPIENLESA